MFHGTYSCIIKNITDQCTTFELVSGGDGTDGSACLGHSASLSSEAQHATENVSRVKLVSSGRVT